MWNGFRLIRATVTNCKHIDVDVSNWTCPL